MRRRRGTCEGAEGETARTPAWIAVARPRGRDEEAETERAERAECAECAATRARMWRLEREFDEQWEAESAAVRAEVIRRDAEWTKRVDRYRRAASDARAAHEADKARWAAERGGEARSKAIERLKVDIAELKAACRELRASAELANQLIAPAVACALEGVRLALGDGGDASDGGE